MSDPFVGEIRMFGGNFAPVGWAFCNGQLVAIADNDVLFALIGTTYGGDGQTTFGLPDLQGRVPLHQGQGPSLQSRSIGERFGSESVTLSPAAMPLHGHSQLASANAATAAAGPSGAPASSATTSFYGSGNPDVAMAGTAIGNAGGGQAHDNMAPYLALNFIICLFGIFPSRN